jgi:hypothetical protein
MEENNMKGKSYSKLVLSLIALVALLLAGYFYYQFNTLKKNPQAVAQKETADLVSKVSKLVLLPEGETPTVATVSDPEKLKDQAFFAKAMVGDKVLIYAQAKKAVLYSVSLNKIIDVAPLNIGTQKAVTPPAPKDEN